MGCVLALCLTTQTFAIEGLKLQIRCPHVALSWPSTNDETYIVQYRATLDTNSTWQTLTNFMPPASGTNTTFFVHSNRVDCPSGQVFGMMIMSGGGESESMSAKVSTLSAAERTQVKQAHEEVRLATLYEKCKQEGREPTEQELKNQPPLPPSIKEVRAKILAAKEKSAARLSGNALSETTLSVGKSSLESFEGSGGANGPQPEGAGGGGGASEPSCGFYRVVRNGLHLGGITNGFVVEGYLELPVELGSTNNGFPQIRFYVDNLPCAGASIQPGDKGCPVLKWNTHFLPNGSHDVWLVADFSGEEVVLYGKTTSITVTNDVTFDLDLNSFGEQMWLFARFVEQVSFQIKIYDDESNNYIGTFAFNSGTDGTVSFLWNLLDPQQNLVTSKFIRGEFNATSITPQGGGRTLKSGTNVWTKQTGWFSDKFVVAWANTAKVNAPSRMENLMRYGVVDILANPAHDSPYQLSPGNAFGTGTAFRLTENSRTNLLNYLSDPDYRNFYYFGHGNGGGFGDSSRWDEAPPWIREGELRNALTNRLGEIPRAVTEHPYRFVFLDTCNSANGYLCEAFGIHRRTMTVSVYVNYLKMKPRAFIGFTDFNPLPDSLNEHLQNANMLAAFFAQWMGNVSLNGCIATAKQDPFWPMHQSVLIYGAQNLYRLAP